MGRDRAEGTAASDDERHPSELDPQAFSVIRQNLVAVGQPLTLVEAEYATSLADMSRPQVGFRRHSSMS